jgi:Gpi18-like mannosyltransferase
LTALISKFAVFAIAYVSTYFTNGGPTDPGYILLLELVRWDSQQYLHIAQFGYVNQGDAANGIAFFPFYPFLIRIITFDFSYAGLSGLVISNVCSILTVVHLFRLVKLDYNDGVAKKTILFLCIFPTACFLSAAYTESVFLALTISSLYYARNSKWSLAGLLGVLSALTRITGLVLVPALIIEYLYQKKWTIKLEKALSLDGFSSYTIMFKGLDWKFLWSLVPGLGFLIYLFINFIVTGNPLTFASIQSTHFFQDFNPLAGWESAIGHWTTASYPFNLTIGLSQLIFATFGYLMIVAGYKLKLRPSYQICMFFTWFFAVSTSFWLSVPRYTLVIFPQFIVLALLSTRKSVTIIITILSLAVFLYYTWWFATGQWTA